LGCFPEEGENLGGRGGGFHSPPEARKGKEKIIFWGGKGGEPKPPRLRSEGALHRGRDVFILGREIAVLRGGSPLPRKGKQKGGRGSSLLKGEVKLFKKSFCEKKKGKEGGQIAGFDPRKNAGGGHYERKGGPQ